MLWCPQEAVGTEQKHLKKINCWRTLVWPNGLPTQFLGLAHCHLPYHPTLSCCLASASSEAPALLRLRKAGWTREDDRRGGARRRLGRRRRFDNVRGCDELPHRGLRRPSTWIRHQCYRSVSPCTCTYAEGVKLHGLCPVITLHSWRSVPLVLMVVAFVRLSLV